MSLCLSAWSQSISHFLLQKHISYLPQAHLIVASSPLFRLVFSLKQRMLPTCSSVFLFSCTFSPPHVSCILSLSFTESFLYLSLSLSSQPLLLHLLSPHQQQHPQPRPPQRHLLQRPRSRQPRQPRQPRLRLQPLRMAAPRNARRANPAPQHAPASLLTRSRRSDAFTVAMMCANTTMCPRSISHAASGASDVG